MCLRVHNCYLSIEEFILRDWRSFTFGEACEFHQRGGCCFEVKPFDDNSTGWLKLRTSTEKRKNDVQSELRWLETSKSTWLTCFLDEIQRMKDFQWLWQVSIPRSPNPCTLYLASARNQALPGSVVGDFSSWDPVCFVAPLNSICQIISVYFKHVVPGCSRYSISLESEWCKCHRWPGAWCPSVA
jgi:hypothetical protein